MVRHWLVKSEPSAYSIDRLAKDKRTGWDGVRNFVARNHMRAMQVGDRLLFYHSNAEPSGVVGVAEVVGLAHTDPTQFDAEDSHYDPDSNPENPRWDMVDVGFVRKLPRIVPLDELKAAPQLVGMLLTSGKAARLSVQPVDAKHFAAIVKMAETAPKDATVAKPKAVKKAKKTGKSRGRA